MKAFSAFFFTILYIAAMIRPVAPLFEYIIYEDYIAEFLCVNKDNVALDCHGKCYLMKSLNEQNEQKKQNLPRISMEEYPIGFVELTSLEPTLHLIAKDHSPKFYHNTYNFLFGKAQFHPPNFVS